MLLNSESDRAQKLRNFLLLEAKALMLLASLTVTTLIPTEETYWSASTLNDKLNTEKSIAF